MKRVISFVVCFLLLACFVHADQQPLVSGENWGTTRGKINNNDADNDGRITTNTTNIADKADKTNVLELDNTTPFTPDADHEPATKKYVDDNAAAGAVSSVEGRTGAVILTSADVDLENADNTSDLNKPVSTLTQTALDGKEPVKGVDDNYVTDSEKVIIGNTSGTNTGDKTDPEIKTAYEANADTNAYTDTEKTKLAGVAEGATNFDPANAGDITATSLSVDGTDGLNGLTNVSDNTSQGAVGQLALIPLNGVWNKVEGGVASPIGTGDAYTKSESDALLADKINTSAVDDVGAVGADKLWSSEKTKAYIDAILGFPLVSIIAPTEGQWVTESPYTGFNGTASDGGSIASMEGKLEAGGTYVATTGTETWSVASVPVTEGGNTLYARATDDQSNQTEVPVTFNVDSIAPVVVADADSAHDGTTPVVSGMTLTEVNPGAMTASVVGATPTTTALTGTYPDYVTVSLTPDGVGDITVTFDGVADLAGNVAATVVQEFLYSVPVVCSTTPTIETYGEAGLSGIGNTNTRALSGQLFTTATSYSTCQFDVALRVHAGDDINARTYTAHVYNTNATGSGGTPNLTTLVGTAEAPVLGSSLTTSYQRVSFTFSPAITINQFDALVIQVDSVNADYADSAIYNDGSGDANSERMTWRSDLSFGEYTVDSDFAFDLFEVE